MIYVIMSINDSTKLTFSSSTGTKLSGVNLWAHGYDDDIPQSFEIPRNPKS